MIMRKCYHHWLYVVVVQNETSILLYMQWSSMGWSQCNDAKPEKNALEIWIFQINTIDLIAILPKLKLNSFQFIQESVKLSNLLDFIANLQIDSMQFKDYQSSFEKSNRNTCTINENLLLQNKL